MKERKTDLAENDEDITVYVCSRKSDIQVLLIFCTELAPKMLKCRRFRLNIT